MASDYLKKALGAIGQAGVTHYQAEMEAARQQRLEMLKGSQALEQEQERGNQQRLGYRAQREQEESLYKYKQDNPDLYTDLMQKDSAGDDFVAGQRGPGNKITWKTYNESIDRVSKDKAADRTMQIQIKQLGLADTVYRMQTSKEIEDKRSANRIEIEKRRGRTQKTTTVIHEMNENLRNKARVEAQMAAARTAVMFESDVPFFGPDGDYLEMRTQAHAYIDGKFYTVVGNQLMSEEEANRLLEGRAISLYDQYMADGDEDEAQTVLDNYRKSYGRDIDPANPTPAPQNEPTSPPDSRPPPTIPPPIDRRSGVNKPKVDVSGGDIGSRADDFGFTPTGSGNQELMDKWKRQQKIGGRNPRERGLFDMQEEFSRRSTLLD